MIYPHGYGYIINIHAFMWYIYLYVSMIPSRQNILRYLFGEMFLIMSQSICVISPKVHNHLDTLLKHNWSTVNSGVFCTLIGVTLCLISWYSLCAIVYWYTNKLYTLLARFYLSTYVTVDIILVLLVSKVGRAPQKYAPGLTFSWKLWFICIRINLGTCVQCVIV